MNKHLLFLSSLILLLLSVSGLMVFSREPGYDDAYYLQEENNNVIPKKSGINLLWNYTTGNNVTSVAISSDGEYITAGSDDNNTYLFNYTRSTSKIPVWINKTGGAVKAISMSSDGEYIVAGSNDNHIYLYNRSHSKPVWNYTIGDNVRAVSISSDKNYIVAASNNNKISFLKNSI